MASLLGRLGGTFTCNRVAPRAIQQRVAIAPCSRPQRGALFVVAADAGEKKKRTDPAAKRAQLATERRMRNRSRKSACSTYMKKVLKHAAALMKAPPTSETDAQVAVLEKLVSDAYKQIDMAVTKGVYHANTASRKKARMAKYKRQVLIAGGLYVPTPEQPGYSFYKRTKAPAAQ